LIGQARYNGPDQITNLITWVGGQERVKRFEHTSTNGFSRLTQVMTPAGKLFRLKGSELNNGVFWHAVARDSFCAPC
jgi:hypothetical protein